MNRRVPSWDRPKKWNYVSKRQWAFKDESTKDEWIKVDNKPKPVRRRRKNDN